MIPPAIRYLLLLILLGLTLHAQSLPDTSHYRFWSPRDSVFRLTGTSVGDMRAVRELRLDYVRGYNAFSAEDLTRMMNYPNGPFEAARGRFYREAYRAGITIINPIVDVGIDLKNLRAVENYARVDPLYFHNLHFTTVGDWGVYDTVMHGLAYGVTAPALPRAERREVLMASGPVYNAYWAFHRGDAAIYRRIGLPDRSTYFRASVAIRVDTSRRDYAELPDDAPIARLILYRRARAGQEECRCGIYEPFDTLAVTKRSLRDSSDAAEGAPGYRDVGVTFDAEAAGIPLHILNDDPAINGDGFDWFGFATCGEGDCRAILAGGGFAPGAIVENVDRSDFNLRLYTTSTVPVTFLRSRVNQDLYDQLRAGRLDSIIRAGVRSLLAHDTLRGLIARLPYSDETTFHKYRSDGLLARKLQDFLRLEGDSTIQLWCNPPDNFAAFRVLTGDLDSDRLKTIQLIVRQDYKQIGAADDAIPIFHANPDSMSAFATARTYEGMIAGHDSAAYSAYTIRRQRGFGRYLDSRGAEATFDGPLVRSLARLVDVAKVRYRAIAPPTPVWNTIQDYGIRGYRRDPPDGVAAYYGGWGLRPPTPEEITAQAWLSLNCGVDGLVYADLQYDGLNFGPLHSLGGIPRRNYEALYPPNIRGARSHADSLKYMQPKLWTGFRSRYDAIRAMNREIRLLDSLIHLPALHFDGEQMSLHDPRQSFRSMPLLDTVMAERASRYRRGARGAFTGSDTIDTREETYMELTHFLGGDRDSGSHYLLFTNRRCWPVDTLRYGDSARSHGARRTGLGAIDVRRPVIVMKRLPGSTADTFIIEKVGHEGEWKSRTVMVGERVELDWLRPGWGVVYRVRVEGER